MLTLRSATLPTEDLLRLREGEREGLLLVEENLVTLVGESGGKKGFFGERGRTGTLMGDFGGEQKGDQEGDLVGDGPMPMVLIESLLVPPIEEATAKKRERTTQLEQQWTPSNPGAGHP